VYHGDPDHIAFLNAKVILTEGPMPERKPECEDGAKAGGCGAGCGCVSSNGDSQS